MSKRKANHTKDERADSKTNPPLPAVLWEWVSRHSALFFVAVMAIASVRIVSTYSIFNHTVDEPSHVACGMEWLEKGIYRIEPQHPPLARVASALGPYLLGLRGHGVENMSQEGALILYQGNYDRNLAAARLGILPFFWICSAVLFLWTLKNVGTREAAAALFLFTFLPTVLAHAGLATTDMALTAFLGASFFSGMYWLEKPNIPRTVLFGCCSGLAVLSKFSALPYLPCAFLAALVWYCRVERASVRGILTAARTRVLPLLLAIAVGTFVIWAGYRFSFGPNRLLSFSVPAPELFNGIKDLIEHDRSGHPSYLLGMHSMHGWWYFFPVVLAVKTPIPFMVFLLFGIAAIWKRDTAGKLNLGIPLVFSLAILIYGMTSNINIGLRHILPVYIGFSIVAAAGMISLLEMAKTLQWAKWILLLSVVWYAGTSLLSHPDYIPYFNFLAGNEPEQIVADSDLDWGQDMKRLGKKLQEVGAREVTFSPFIVAYLEQFHGFPPIHQMELEAPSAGWNAASLTELKAYRLGLGVQQPDVQLWPDHIPPTTRVGKTTLLWYFPPRRK
jgi:hypothetical protein